MPITFGLIGAGPRAKFHSQALVNLGLSCVAACDAQGDVAKTHAADYGYKYAMTDHREVLKREDIDAVVIVLPQNSAGAVILDALRAGKHVLTEKPLCTTMAVGRQIVEVARNVNKVCLCSHNYRFEPSVIAVRDAIRSGRIGEVFLVNGRLIGPPNYLYARPGYRTRSPDNPSTVVLGNGIHGLDILRFWLGDASTASAVFRDVVSRSFGGTGEDTGVCRIEFNQGAVASFVVSDGDVSLAAAAWEFDVYGSGGMIRWRYPEAHLLPRHLECHEQFRPDRDPVEEVVLHEQAQQPSKLTIIERIYRHFIDVVNGHEPLQLSADEALRSLDLTLGMTDSAHAGGKPIQLESPVSLTVG